MERIIAGGAMLLTALFFAGLGAWQYRRTDKPVGFYSHQPAPPAGQISDIPAYNRGHAKLWFGFAAGVAALGVLAFVLKNDAQLTIWGLATAPASIVMVVAIILGHNRLERRYRHR